MVQWYGNVPADVNIMLNVPPGAIGPELHWPPSAVDVCVLVSLLVQDTVPPTATTTGLGAYAVVVSVEEPLTIDAATVELDDDVVGDGVAGVDCPQASDEARISPTTAIRNLMATTSRRRASQTRRPPRRSLDGVFP
jgi:hypothetical protein